MQVRRSLHAARDLRAVRVDAALETGLQTREAGPARRSVGAALIDDHLAYAAHHLHLPREGIALIALAGYARRDLGPLSTFDCALVWDDANRAFSAEHADDDGYFDPQALASSLWFSLWEGGVAFRPHVYSLSECAGLGSRGPDAVTTFLGARRVWGDPRLATRAIEAATAQWHTLVHTHWAEVETWALTRGEAYPTLGKSGEPNLVLDRGGIKDLTAAWALRMALPPAQDSLPPDAALAGAARVLRDVRDALHLVHGTATGRLTASHATAVAGLTGLGTGEDVLTQLDWAGRAVSVELRRAVRAHRHRRGQETPDPAPENFPWLPSGIQPVIQTDGLFLAGEGPLTRLELLSAIRCCASSGREPSAHLVERARMGPASHEPEWSARERSLLAAIFCEPHALAAWEVVDVYGILPAWVPGWEELRGRTLHIFGQRVAADRMLVETAIAAAELTQQRESVDAELAIWAVVITGLAEADPQATAERVGWEPAQAKVIATVAREHDRVSHVAQTSDLMDEAAITAIADAVHGNTHTLACLENLVRARARASGAAVSATREEKFDFLVRSVRAVLDSRYGTAHDDPVQHALATLQGVNPQIARLALLGAHSDSRVGVVLTPEEGAAGSRHLVVAFPTRPHSLLALTAMAAEYGIELVSGSFDIRGAHVFSAWWVRPRGNAFPHPSVVREFLATRLGLSATRAPRAARRTAPSREAPRGRLVHAVVESIAPHASTGRAFQVTAEDRPRLVGDLASALAPYPVTVVKAHVVRLESRTVCALYLDAGPKARGWDGLAPRLQHALEQAANRR